MNIHRLSDFNTVTSFHYVLNNSPNSWAKKEFMVFNVLMFQKGSYVINLK